MQPQSGESTTSDVEAILRSCSRKAVLREQQGQPNTSIIIGTLGIHASGESTLIMMRHVPVCALRYPTIPQLPWQCAHPQCQVMVLFHSLTSTALCSTYRSDAASNTSQSRRGGQHAVAPAFLGAAWLQAGAQLSPEHRLAVTDLARQCLSSIGAPLPYFTRKLDARSVTVA